ncbi:structural protein [Lactobacillus taiwanensis]|uniref:hypothetical protein n=1 Tax=Lactobacillus taiwanensis TaxID=508451 RepID=UPI000B98A4E8|nr:hypothetical protein [Lactobacillus taiwanensis]OYR95108.1 hypothetical protein CBF51_09065 [Lactobacillus taiwanensis]OYS02497.1 hypothetical protein CBF61_02360 [Lactobacillus taiwanensis]OYS16216.1 hypothetical protein CBF69_02540 [Lactobacillus taiwanensis]OYS16295.1 hypothetical protein CBF69_03015 [Lactobacillus taiwanensis]OYS32349.1 hypothetical protein CBF85_10550 [Lactobacillus taiwanensis]
MTTVKQEKQRINQLLNRDVKTDKDIDEIYNEAVDRLRAVVNQAFDKYSVDGILVPANLHKKVTRSDMLLLKRQYEKLPDELELPEIERRDNYLAVSQTSQRGLITATLGMALIGVTHKIVSAIKKNNRTAVDDEVQYIQQNNDLSKTQKKRIRTKARKIEQPDYEFKSSNDLNVPWLDRIWLDHDKMLNRIDSTINDQLKQGMRAEDIADKLFPENAESMRQDNIPKSVRDASISAKRLARTEAATREDELTERSFKSQKVKYYDWVTEPGACKKCLAIASSGPYKFGDPDSPRPPVDSHPNCRCRRISVDKDEVDNSKTALIAGSLSATIKNKKIENSESSYTAENVIINEKHSVPLSAEPNTILDTYKNGKRIKRRYYDANGIAIKDIDFTDHGNPKEHPIVPHAHDWSFKEKDGKKIPKRSSYRELTIEEKKQVKWEGEIRND